MNTNTVYSTWYPETGDDTPGHTILDATNGGDAEWRERMESSGALARIERDYRGAVNEALPDGVTLIGDQFYGPAYVGDRSWEGDLDIRKIIEGIDLQEIIDRHDVDKPQ